MLPFHEHTKSNYLSDLAQNLKFYHSFFFRTFIIQAFHHACTVFARLLTYGVPAALLTYARRPFAVLPSTEVHGVRKVADNALSKAVISGI